MKKKYYSLKDILKKDCEYNLIIGERSNGKTYATLKHILECYIKNGSQGAYIRRWKEDITGKRGDSIFSSLIENNEISKITNGKYTNVIYYRRGWFLANWNEEEKKFISEKEPFCYGFSLSDMEHDKSNSFPKIKNILFDEFLTRQYYLPDEFMLFMNVLSTIIRDRNDVKIFMCANTVNRFSPYFSEMGLSNITTQKQGTIDIYTYKDNLKLALEYCAETEKIFKKSNKYFAFNNPKLNMITKGNWELDLYPHLPIGTKIQNDDIVFSFLICFNDNIISCDVVQKEADFFIFCHKKTTEIKIEKEYLIYDLENHIESVYRKYITKPTSKIEQKISKMFLEGKIFYQSNEIGEIIRNYLIQSTKQGV